MSAPESLPRAVRRRAREEITREIIEVAHRHLATLGAPGLSVRAVARELGMVSSAVYRYVPSRDELLTLLIVDAYDALGASVEAAEADVARALIEDRWLAVCHGVRDWALGHPHEYALLYGSPVPGYVAPEATIGPATRVTALLSQLLGDAAQAGPGTPPTSVAGSDDGWAAALGPVREFVPGGVPDDLLLRGLMAWTALFGTVSLELFGHYHRVVDDDPGLRRAFFAESMRRVGEQAGLVAPTP